jgi:hypothetical protein
MSYKYKKQIVSMTPQRSKAIPVQTAQRLKVFIGLKISKLLLDIEREEEVVKVTVKVFKSNKEENSEISNAELKIDKLYKRIDKMKIKLSKLENDQRILKAFLSGKHVEIV